MGRIVPTLEPDEIGLQVANLQEALRLLLDRDVIRSVEAPNQPTASELARLKKELADERA